MSCAHAASAGSVPTGLIADDDRLDRAPVDAAVGVDVVDEDLVRRLVVAVVEGGDVAERLEVDVLDADLDRVVGHARRRAGGHGDRSGSRRRRRRVSSDSGVVVAGGAADERERRRPRGRGAGDGTRMRVAFLRSQDRPILTDRSAVSQTFATRLCEPTCSIPTVSCPPTPASAASPERSTRARATCRSSARTATWTPGSLADDAPIGDPAVELVTRDHYLLRMLYSQGVPLEALGCPPRDDGAEVADGRSTWRTFAEHYHLFRATPSKLWLDHTLSEVFGVAEPLGAGQRRRRLRPPRRRPGRATPSGPGPSSSASASSSWPPPTPPSTTSTPTPASGPAAGPAGSCPPSGPTTSSTPTGPTSAPTSTAWPR